MGSDERAKGKGYKKWNGRRMGEETRRKRDRRIG